MATWATRSIVWKPFDRPPKAIEDQNLLARSSPDRWPARATLTRRWLFSYDWRTEGPNGELIFLRLLIQKTSLQPRGKRNWQDVERHLVEVERALPQSIEPLLLPAGYAGGRDRLDDARKLLTSKLRPRPRNLRGQMALARLLLRQGQNAEASRALDQAEKDLGPSLDIQMARLYYWGTAGGAEARAMVAKLAEGRAQFPAADARLLLEQLARVETQLGEPALPVSTCAARRARARRVPVLLSLFSWPRRAPTTPTPRSF